MTASAATIVLVPAAAAAAPLLATWLGRIVRIPLVVFEIAFGILLGPAALGWVSPDEIISSLADFGLAMLFFLAGSEIDIDRIRGRVLNRSILGWLVALVAGLAVGIASRRAARLRSHRGRLHRDCADQHRIGHDHAGVAGRR